MIINSKTNKSPTEKPLTTEEKLFKVLESIDWKLWEMMNMMKAQSPLTTKPAPKSRNTIKKNSE